MGGISDFLKNAYLYSTFWHGGALYIGLYTDPPTDAGGGTEVSAADYQRCKIFTGETWWGLSGIGIITNKTTALFTASQSNWGHVTHWGIFNSNHNGNLHWWGSLKSSFEVVTGAVVKIDPGEISLRIISG